MKDPEERVNLSGIDWESGFCLDSKEILIFALCIKNFLLNLNWETNSII